jgi:hypothetical protein
MIPTTYHMNPLPEEIFTISYDQTPVDKIQKTRKKEKREPTHPKPQFLHTPIWNPSNTT